MRNINNLRYADDTTIMVERDEELKSLFYGCESFPDTGKHWRQKKGVTEDEMVGWHYQLSGHEFE